MDLAKPVELITSFKRMILKIVSSSSHVSHRDEAETPPFLAIQAAASATRLIEPSEFDNVRFYKYFYDIVEYGSNRRLGDERRAI